MEQANPPQTKGPVQSVLKVPATASAKLRTNTTAQKGARGFIYLYLAGMVFLMGFDLWLEINAVPGSTWSELMRVHGRQHLILPWLCGVLIGHLYHHKHDREPIWGLSHNAAYSLIGWISIVLAPIGFLAPPPQESFAEYSMAITVIIGVIVGHYLWPAKRDGSLWEW